MMVSKMITQSTADLSNVSLQVRFIRNLYPPETGTTESGFLEGEWREGRNIIGVNVFKRSGIGMYKLDATMTANGDTLPYYSGGANGRFLDKDEVVPQHLVIETTSGQRAEFDVEPIEEVNIKSVNGGSGVVDLGDDLVLEFDVPAGVENRNMQVSLLMDVMGVRDWVDIVQFREKERVVIPASAFRHLPGLSPISGESYLRVERYKVSPAIHNAGVGAAQVLSLSWDAVPVEVAGKRDAVYGISVSDEMTSEKGTMEFDITKPNAFLGKPLSSGKKFALTSLSVRATKLKQSRTKTSSSSSYYGSYKVTTTTTTTKTRKFPTLPDEFWEGLVDDMYDDVVQTFQDNYNIELIPVEQVTATPSYQELETIDDGVTEVEVSKSYKNTKNLIPTTLGAIIGSVSSTFASDRVDARLIEELDVDGLIAVTLDLEMPWESFSLSPRLSFRVSGPPNGYKLGPTIYAQGVVWGNGVELDSAKAEATDPTDILNRVVRKDEIIRALDAGLKELEAKEQEFGYDKIWALQE
ncbi:MAG: hypothetical protein K9N46_14050 [Candidatus Marinimicrobia bacterium]|nr:hypothetical protein [Candidatus Neomarinimicrobiota bacterium]MCF7881851.1 hypothetical protein [Candidatus Neomarinimicrobiota bacterium]